MVENRTLPFLNQFKGWLRENLGNVAISCHGNSMRPIRRVFENLSLKQMLQIETPKIRLSHTHFTVTKFVLKDQG